MFPSRSFINSGFTFRYMVHFWGFQNYTLSSLSESLIVSASFLRKTILFPLNKLGTFVKKKTIDYYVYGSISRLFLLHWLICRFYANIKLALLLIFIVQIFRSCSMNSPALFYIVKNFLAILCILLSIYILKYIFQFL